MDGNTLVKSQRLARKRARVTAHLWTQTNDDDPGGELVSPSMTTIHEDSSSSSSSSSSLRFPKNPPLPIMERNQCQRIYANFVSAWQSYDSDKIKEFLLSIASPSLSLSIIHVQNDDKGPERLSSYREIHGMEAVLSYIIAEQQTFPDGINLFKYLSSNYVPNFPTERKYFIECDYRFEGHRVYSLEVVDLLTAFQATDEVVDALTGLAALSTPVPDPLALPPPPPAPLPPTAPLLQSCNAFSICPQLQAHYWVDGSKELARARRGLEEMTIFMSTEQARFAKGQRLRSAEAILTIHGKIQLVLDTSFSLIKIKYLL